MRRITIVIDNDNEKKLRNIQAKRIVADQKYVPLSRLINEQLRKSLRNVK